MGHQKINLLFRGMLIRYDLITKIRSVFHILAMLNFGFWKKVDISFHMSYVLSRLTLSLFIFFVEFILSGLLCTHVKCYAQFRINGF